MMPHVRHDWTKEEIKALYETPLLTLLLKAQNIHALYHDPTEVQVCTLISIKTGGCPEDCKYCSQSARYQTEVNAEPLMEVENVIAIARRAKAAGATRLCLGAAWREVRDSRQFDTILEMVKEITALGVEVCCTLGLLTTSQAERLKKAGLYAYNHNLDSSEKFYKTIITTRTYAERLQTLDHVDKAGISLCCGGIIGMGEEIEDRLELLHRLSNRTPHPESFPVNQLSPVPGTPLENALPVPIWEMLRLVATARILLPKAMIRLSAGRIRLSLEQQLLCFLAGANSIFSGEEEKMLTKAVPNASFNRDQEMFALFGLKNRPAFVEKKSC